MSVTTSSLPIADGQLYCALVPELAVEEVVLDFELEPGDLRMTLLSVGVMEIWKRSNDSVNHLAWAKMALIRLTSCL